MFDMKTFKMARLTTFFQEKGRGCLTAIRNFKGAMQTGFYKLRRYLHGNKTWTYFPCHFCNDGLFLSPAARLLVIETSRAKAMLLVSPLIFIIMVKVCFIVKILVTYDRSRSLMKLAVNYIWMKGREGLRHAKETLPVGLNTPSHERVKTPRF